MSPPEQFHPDRCWGRVTKTVSSKTPRQPFEETLLLSNPKRAHSPPPGLLHDAAKTEVNDK